MKLRIVAKEETYHYEAASDIVTIGRSSENDFVIPLVDFSRKHCVVTFKGDYAFIMDLGSKNGVMIDGHRIPSNQQFPIYQSSKVFLANYFQFILPEGTSIKLTDDLNLEFEGIKEEE